MEASGDHGWLKDHIRDIPDFPRAGVAFKDLTPLLGDAFAFAAAVDAIAGPFAASGITKVVGVEARGFILAAPVALRLGAGFVPVRKVGKLPAATLQATYELEYGTDILEIHADAIAPDDRVLIVDDVIATGGTAIAAADLVGRLGGTVVAFGFLIEIGFLGGRQRLGDSGTAEDVVVLVAYE